MAVATLSPPPLSPRGHPLLPLLPLLRHPTEFAQAHAALTKLGLIRHTHFSTHLLTRLVLSPDPATSPYALRLFLLDPRPNTLSFNVLIRGLVNHRHHTAALSIFISMLSAAKPNSLTFPFVLKACSTPQILLQVHAILCKLGFGTDSHIQNAVILMYLQHGLVFEAVKTFDRMPQRDAVSWNTMIDGLAGMGFLGEAREVFDGMPDRNVSSWNCLINGYVKFGTMEAAWGLFARAPVKSAVTWNTMITGYMDVGRDGIDSASELYGQMPPEMKDLITMNVMIDGYMRDCICRYADALRIFDEMHALGIHPNNFALVSVLTACSHLAALDTGERVNQYIQKRRFLLDAVLGTALFNMYAKCGRFERAIHVFYGMQDRDVSAWNSMIASCGAHGYGREALTMLFKMLDSGVAPGDVTLLSVLSACRHLGMVEAGRRSLYLMKEMHGISPKSEHFGCMVDLLCRAGKLDNARELLEGSDAKFSVRAWGALLGASNRVGDVKMGEYAAKKLLELDPEDMQCYVELSNMYSKVGRWEDSIEVREVMRSRGMQKVPGSSSIEVSGAVHEFRVGSSDSF